MRLLIWNIQFFTQSRVNNTTVTGVLAYDQDANARALACLNHIISTVREADPDIFVVLEVRSGQGNIAELANGEGPPGLLFLLTQMRQQLSDKWCLVPPLRVNPRAIDDNLLRDSPTYTEAVGVFWRDDRLGFTGPLVWPLARRATGPPVPLFSEPSAPYPDPWNTAVPEGSVFAPKIRFYSASDREVLLADPEASFARRPVLTTFYERAGMERRIRLFSVHTKPSAAGMAMRQLGAIQDKDWVPADNEVTIFAGDFNLNLLNLKTVLEQCDVGTFKTGGTRPRPMIPLLAVSGNYPPSVYYTNTQADTTAYLKNAIYDYAFVTYGKDAKPSDLPVVRGVVANRVAGVTPGGSLPAFTCDMTQDLTALALVNDTKNVQIAASPGGLKRQGNVTTIKTAAAHGLNPGDVFTISGTNRIAVNVSGRVQSVPTPTSFTFRQSKKATTTGGGGRVNTRPRTNAFRQRQNFGHIGPPVSEGTSDHLPVLVIV